MRRRGHISLDEKYASMNYGLDQPIFFPTRKERAEEEKRNAGYQQRLPQGYTSVGGHIPYVNPQAKTIQNYSYSGPIFTRTGDIFPPKPTRKRVADKSVVRGTPCGIRIKNLHSIRSDHSVFYDRRIGEIILIVKTGSDADRFYSFYFSGGGTFPHILKMSGGEMMKIINSPIPPVMLIINDEPVFWGFGHQLRDKRNHDKDLQNQMKEAKTMWLQLQEPTILEPRVRPVFDLPRLRLTYSMLSAIKS